MVVSKSTLSIPTFFSKVKHDLWIKSTPWKAFFPESPQIWGPWEPVTGLTFWVRVLLGVNAIDRQHSGVLKRLQTREAVNGKPHDMSTIVYIGCLWLPATAESGKDVAFQWLSIIQDLTCSSWGLMVRAKHFLRKWGLQTHREQQESAWHFFHKRYEGKKEIAVGEHNPCRPSSNAVGEYSQSRSSSNAVRENSPRRPSSNAVGEHSLGTPSSPLTLFRSQKFVTSSLPCRDLLELYLHMCGILTACASDVHI